jgi:catechol 2,3-dioxygenase-like lactoylglutathione lyase family enzyme
MAVIKSRFISHGTLGSKDLARSRKFYEEFLGLECVQTSKISMMIRLGGDHVYAVVQDKRLGEMPRINHNGIDVHTDQDVDDAYRAVLDTQEEWGLYNVSKPVVQHGTYSFHFWDMDGNTWEILSNPRGGYTWIFDQGDLEGKGHWDRDFRKNRPDAVSTG